MPMGSKASRMESTIEHPATEILAAYWEERLADEEMEAIRDHLAGCPHCAEVLLLIGEGTATEDFSQDAEALPAWRELRGALVREGLLEAPQAVPIRPPAFRFERLWAIAATLAFLLLGGYTLNFQRLVPQSSLIEVDPPLFSLMPENQLRLGQPAKAPTLELPPGGRAWLVLNHAEPTPAERLRLRVRGLPGGELLFERELRPADPRSVRLEIGAGLLPPGQCEIELEAFAPAEPDSWKSIAVYRLDVSAMARP
jgi:hypothetical protein